MNMFKQLLQTVCFRITRTSNGIINTSHRLSQTLSASNQSKHFCTQPQPDDPKSDMSDPFVREKTKCLLCQNNVPLTYKNVQLLSQFISPNTGHIYGQRITKLCRRQQKRISYEIKRSRRMGYMPVMYRDTIFLKDPDLFGSHYAGEVNIGDAVRLEPRPLIDSPVQKKTEKKERFKRSTESKKTKKK
ncbi:uncharacterized protein [Antedon mediterranea]|uniref:uncharacterized protein n=1 Tax=Antedon mediterranea TaxID=105859 RepID=UPI003AF7118F